MPSLEDLRSTYGAAVEACDSQLEPQVLTDKEPQKLVPCRQCRRACVVHVFASAPKTSCLTCRGVGAAGPRIGELGMPIPGRTDPAKAANLVDCLLNPTFAHAVCPLDAEHDMELKSVSHNPNYGPRRIVGYEKGDPVYKTETGETVTHQCRECHTVVSYSTTHQVDYRRQNEPREVPSEGPPTLSYLLGARS